jgi:hypothetical protein
MHVSFDHIMATIFSIEMYQLGRANAFVSIYCVKNACDWRAFRQISFPVNRIIAQY